MTDNIRKETTGWFTVSCRRMGILCLVLAATAIAQPSQNEQDSAGPPPVYSVLYNFTGGADGGTPLAGLIRDAAGNLYGTTSGGGNTSSSCSFGSSGCGVVFKLDPAGNEAVLYTFSGGMDGAFPQGSLIRDGAGNLYGTTSYGGNFSGPCSLFGCGVVFELGLSGKETVLYTFTGGTDGAFPLAGLIRDAHGNLYGTAYEGGEISGSCPFWGSSGCGVVFKVDPAGKETVLHAFTGTPDGETPAAGLIRDTAGNLYGTTQYGGNTSGSCSNGFPGCGVVFKVDPSGNETVLYSFTGGADGLISYAPLARDSDGNLYGTTGYGGYGGSSCVVNGSLGCGVVFKLDPSRKETVLYTFTGGADGAFPAAGLVGSESGEPGEDGPDGREFYGQTTFGGGSCAPFGCGVVFKVDASGKETVLHSFSGTDGSEPAIGGVLLRHGNSLSGTASVGGAYGAGVVFKLTLKQEH